MEICLFQFTPLREGLPEQASVASTLADFNSRPCERGFAIQKWCGAKQDDFNSRPCERGFILQRVDCVQLIIFQFTPLREGLPQPLASNDDDKIISIHAPARGASFPQKWVVGTDPISIHAPARGASMSLVRSKIRTNFNSRPCERGF